MRSTAVVPRCSTTVTHQTGNLRIDEAQGYIADVTIEGEVGQNDYQFTFI